MSGTTYEISISTGGKVAVTVTSQDPKEMKPALGWAKEVYKHLVDNQVQEQQDEETPICGVHNVPMVRQKGKYGYFWSCHERTNGAFCSYKPEGQ